MNDTQQIFSLFYAILYGVIFTLSDKWKPFTHARSERHEGLKRVISSIIALVMFPVSYFISCFWVMGHISKFEFCKLLITIFLVSPLYAFYSLWAMYVPYHRDTFYSKGE